LSFCAFWHILIAFLAGFRPPSSIFREPNGWFQHSKVARRVADIAGK
jgi:hypothetical protein